MIKDVDFPDGHCRMIVGYREANSMECVVDYFFFTSGMRVVMLNCKTARHLYLPFTPLFETMAATVRLPQTGQVSVPLEHDAPVYDTDNTIARPIFDLDAGFSL